MNSLDLTPFMKLSGIGEQHYKIVYFGPPMGGKRSSLEYLYQAFPHPDKRRMLSLSNEFEYHLVWDGMIFRTGNDLIRFHLSTISGCYVNDLLLFRLCMGVDGIIFVANSKRHQFDYNLEYLRLLEAICDGLRRNFATLPLVFQYNKRDMPDRLDIDTLNQALNPFNKPSVGSIAFTGQGVLEAFKLLRMMILTQRD